MIDRDTAAPHRPPPAYWPISLRMFLRLGATLELPFGAAYVVVAEFREAASALRQQTTQAAFQANRNVHLTLESVRVHLDFVADNVVVFGGTLRPDAATDRAINRAMARNAAIRGVLIHDADGMIVAGAEPQLGLGPPHGVVAATLQMNQDGAGFQVLDQGPGIEPERLETIFEPFGGTHPDAVRPEGGGLGLAISAQIMAAHGGSLTLENRREGGLCATAILPGSTARAAA